MADVAFPGDGPRGVQGLRGSVLGAVRAGYDLATTLDTLRSIVESYGGRFTSASQDAVGRLYSQYADTEVKSNNLAHVRGDISLDTRWVSFAQMKREAEDFRNNPMLAVRYRVSGNIDGAPLDIWRTATYVGADEVPKTVGELRDALESTANDKYKELLSGAEYNIQDVAVTAF